MIFYYYIRVGNTPACKLTQDNSADQVFTVNNCADQTFTFNWDGRNTVAQSPWEEFVVRGPVVLYIKFIP